MKTFLLNALLILGFISTLQAENWNIPKGVYNCEVIYIADENWKTKVMLTKEQRGENQMSFQLFDDKIVDAAGLVFHSLGDNDEGTNTFVDDDYTNAVYFPKNAKLNNGKYAIGIAHISDGSIVRFMTTCTQQ